MKTTIEFLDAVRVQHGLTSDYQLSKLLGTTTSRVGNYRSGRNTLDEAMSVKVAESLKLDPAYVLNCIAAERAKSEKVKRAYMHAAKLVAPAALALLIVLGVLPHHDQLGLMLVGFTAPTADSLYIMLNQAGQTIPMLALLIWIICAAVPRRR